MIRKVDSWTDKDDESELLIIEPMDFKSVRIYDTGKSVILDTDTGNSDPETGISVNFTNKKFETEMFLFSFLSSKSVFLIWSFYFLSGT